MKKKAEPKKKAKSPDVPPPYRPFAKLSKRLAEKPAPAPPAPKRAPRKGGEDAGHGEASTFEDHMRGVRPLGAKALRIPRTTSKLEAGPSAKKVRRDLDEPAREELHALVTDAIRFDVTDDGTCLEGRRLDVDPRELRRLRTMRYAVDGKLDLHGMRASEARVAVGKFLAKRASEGDRAVLVVHGKGNHSPRGDAVLRGELGAWLSQGSASRNVLAFASVLDRSGESGSLFVLLTR